MSRRLTPPILGLLVFGAVVVVAYRALPSAPVRGMVHLATSVAAVAAILVAIRRRRPVDPVPWRFFAASMAAAAAGDLVHAVAAATGYTLGTVSAADVAYASIAPLLGAGLLRITARRLPRHHHGALLESLIVTVAASLLLILFVIEPLMHDVGISRGVAIVVASYPITALALVFVATRLALSVRIRRRATGLLCAATVAALVASVVLAFAVGHTATGPGSVVEALYLLPPLLLVAAAWDPSMAEVTVPLPGDETSTVRFRGSVLLLAALAIVVAAFAPESDRSELVATAVAAAVIGLLVVIRLQRSADEVAALKIETDRAEHIAELARRQTQFATMAAHELRTPLTSLRGSLTTLDRAGSRLPEPQRAEMLAMALRQADRLVRLVADLDVVVQSEAEGFEVELWQVDLGEAARDAVAVLGEPAVSRTRIAADGIVAVADPVRLAQVLGNLVRNAVQYSGGPVDVTAAGTATEVVVEVSDTGPGLDPAVAAEVFARFTLRDGDATGGFGIGLWVVRELVTAMGGRVSYADRPGGGAVFRVVLPRANGEHEPAIPARPADYVV